MPLLFTVFPFFFLPRFLFCFFCFLLVCLFFFFFFFFLPSWNVRKKLHAACRVVGGTTTFQEIEEHASFQHDHVPTATPHVWRHSTDCGGTVEFSDELVQERISECIGEQIADVPVLHFRRAGEVDEQAQQWTVALS